MNDIRSIVVATLVEVAPELDGDGLAGSEHLQDDLELDSMDVLNYFAALSERFGVDIPERDYPQLATVDDAVAYLERVAPAAG